jgi:hypothetical protein
MTITFQLALDPDVMLRIAVAETKEIDSVLTLSSPAIALHVGVIQKTAPKYDGRTFKRLLICRFRNLCGGEKGHRRGSYQDSNLQECVAFACPSYLLLDTSNR